MFSIVKFPASFEIATFTNELSEFFSKLMVTKDNGLLFSVDVLPVMFAV